MPAQSERYIPGNHPQPDTQRVSATDSVLDTSLFTKRRLRFVGLVAAPVALFGGVISMGMRDGGTPDDSVNQTRMTMTLADSGMDAEDANHWHHIDRKST